MKSLPLQLVTFRPLLLLALFPFGLAAAETAAPASLPASPALWEPSDGPNHPMGVGRGIFPGRVTWIRDTAATPWDGKTGNWWDEGTGIRQPAVDNMLSRSLRAISGTSDDAGAWEALFVYFNQQQRQMKAGYRSGEKVAIKINCNNAYGGYGDVDGQIDQSPQVLLGLVRQLVSTAGVPQEMITVYEAVRVVPDRVYAPTHTAFPRVRFVDSQGNGTNGRYPVDYVEEMLSYSVPDPKVGRDLPKCVVEATYLFNVTLVKGHPTTGVSLTAKNHYGTVDVRDHEVYVNAHSHPMGTYHPFVDMIGSRELGAKTVLFILDGLYGIRDVNDNVAEYGHWDKLFHGEWLSSIFVSQDPIAIDSVGLDFLRAEFPYGRSKDKNFQPMRNADNYLHEAALADHPPSGTHYAPDGIPLKSLGVHEHWNNEIDRQYSRNLGRSDGIELLVVPPR
jgi:Domain of unknown function (DUF362)